MASEALARMTPRQKARTFWSDTRQKWRGEARILTEEILRIEEPLLRWTVAAIMDVMSSGFGTVNIRSLGGDIHVHGFDIDAEVHAAFQDQILARVEAQARDEDPEGQFVYEVDPDAIELQAWEWIKERLHGKNAVYLAWLIGRAQNDDASIRTQSIVADRFVWDLKNQCLGVLISQGPPSDVLWVSR